MNTTNVKFTNYEQTIFSTEFQNLIVEFHLKLISSEDLANGYKDLSTTEGFEVAFFEYLKNQTNDVTPYSSASVIQGIFDDNEFAHEQNIAACKFIFNQYAVGAKHLGRK